MKKTDEKRLKILLLDVETAPMKTWGWGLYQELTSTDFVEQEWYILCWAAKWLGADKVYSSSLPKFKSYKKSSEDDKLLMLELWKLLDDADIVVAHNGRKFDCRKINARFIFNGIKPPSPYKVIDTLEVARKDFAFTSNRLNDIAQFLKLGQKKQTGGFSLWKKCMNGDLKSWKLMVNYCVNDILLLEKVYLALRPYIIQHPNLGIYIDTERASCPKCNSSKIQYRGFYYTVSGKYKRFQCLDCGGWGREKENLFSKEKRKSLTTNAS